MAIVHETFFAYMRFFDIFSHIMERKVDLCFFEISCLLVSLLKNHFH